MQISTLTHCSPYTWVVKQKLHVAGKRFMTLNVINQTTNMLPTITTGFLTKVKANVKVQPRLTSTQHPPFCQTDLLVGCFY